jgi:hypothetical protein
VAAAAVLAVEVSEEAEVSEVSAVAVEVSAAVVQAEAGENLYLIQAVCLDD